MSDRELLELAAKAAGIELSKAEWHDDGFYWMPVGAGFWNPLTDDNDALRLVVKLKMRLLVTESCAAVDIYADGAWAGEIKVGCMDSGWNEDPHAATRRAIVRAAAEIGKEMKDAA